jgi:hypothetical protein
VVSPSVAAPVVSVTAPVVLPDCSPVLRVSPMLLESGLHAHSADRKQRVVKE